MSEAQRYEIKLVGFALDHHRVLADLKLLPVAVRPLYESRVVQSIYFDTLDGRAVEENLAGISDRRKLRLRWYGEHGTEVQTQLECKLRNNGYGRKRVFELREPLVVRGELRHRLTARVARALRGEPGGAGVLDGVEPAQWIRYLRDYYQTHDGRLRITIDRELRAYDQRGLLRLEDRRRTPLPDLMIVEIKADAQERDALERFVRELPLRPGKCSKFVMASMPSEGPMPAAYF